MLSLDAATDSVPRRSAQARKDRTRLPKPPETHAPLPTNSEFFLAEIGEYPNERAKLREMDCNPTYSNPLTTPNLSLPFQECRHLSQMRHPKRHQFFLSIDPPHRRPTYRRSQGQPTEIG